MRNRWGIEIRKGDFVTYQGARGGARTGVVASFDKTSAFAKAYGVQVNYDDGGSSGIDDVSRNDGKFEETAPGLLQRGNPAKRKTKKTKRAAPRRKAVPGEFHSPSQATGLAPSPRLVRRRKETAYAPPGIYANPSRVSVRAPSMATGKKPTTRLVKRREATNKAPRGYYANPAPFASVEWKGLTNYIVQVKSTYSRTWRTAGVFRLKSEAHEYAHAKHAADDSLTIRVLSGKT